MINFFMRASFGLIDSFAEAQKYKPDNACVKLFYHMKALLT